MTKEHKLALIVGFSLVLIVGVLISDHFSRARTARVEGSLTERTPDEFGSDTDGLDQPIVAPPPAPVDPIVRATGPLAPLPSEDGRFARAGLLNPDSPVLTMGESLDSSDQRWPFEPVPDRQFAPSARGLPGFEPVPDPARVQRAPSPVAVTPESGTVTPTSPVIVAPPPLVKAVSAEPRKHTVREGETLYGIVRRVYGDGTLWSKLREHNPGVIAPDGTVRAGATLILPPKETLVGRPPRSGSAERQPAPSPSRGGKPAETPTTRPTYGTYTMRPGDTLGEVARKLLKSSRRAEEIASLNNLRDPDSIPAGTVLRVPLN